MQQDRNSPERLSIPTRDEPRRREGLSLLASAAPAKAGTEGSAKKRQTRMSRTSEERWSHLQREYRRAVLAEYPNPGRKDCPGTDALQDLAERIVRREDLRGDPRWKHAIQCGPCYQEYITLRDICSEGSKAVSRQHFR